jgi:hypothetical protein
MAKTRKYPEKIFAIGIDQPLTSWSVGLTFARLLIAFQSEQG